MQRWLGYHSPSFTLDTYVHLLDVDLGEALPLPSLAAGCQREVSADPTETGGDERDSALAETVQIRTVRGY